MPPLLLTCFCSEKRYDLIDAFNSNSRYLDDLLNIDNIHFEHMGHRIYPAELQLIKAISSHVTDFNNRNVFLFSKILKQGYRYHKLRKAFSKFYRRHFELIEKYHVSLKKLMQQGICNPEFYGDLVYKFKKIIGNSNFSNLLKRIVNRFL